MKLPELTVPKIDLPFDIPVLLHPAVDHFAIALPVIVLLLEFYNLFTKRKSIGGFSFMLLVMTVVVFALAYLTGSVDAKETYDLLAPAGQEELKAHKLLGTYLLFGSVGLLVFKLLAMTGKTYFKLLFFLVMIAFVAITFKQGKDGGELVYEYGANIEKVKDLNDDLSDSKELLEETKEAVREAQKAVESSIQSSTIVTTPKTNEVEDNNTVKVKPKKKTVETLLKSEPKESNETSPEVIKTLKDAAKDVEKKIIETQNMENLPVHHETHERITIKEPETSS